MVINYIDSYREDSAKAQLNIESIEKKNLYNSWSIFMNYTDFLFAIL